MNTEDSRIVFKEMLKHAQEQAKAQEEFEQLLGNKIKIIRTTYGLTQKEFADMLKVSHAHISKIENGKDSPSNSLLSVIMAKFNINEKWVNNCLDPNGKRYREHFIFSDYNVLIDNLKFFQKKFGLTKREMESLFDASSYHLDNNDYLKLRGVPVSVIQKLCDYFIISMYDLINTQLDSAQTKDNKNDEFQLSAEESVLLEIYNSCSPKDKKLIIAIINKFQS